MKRIAKMVSAALLLGGAMCWSAVAGDPSQLWNMNCAACHGKDGKGHTMMGHRLQIKDLTDSSVQASLTDDQIIKDIKDGVTENGQTKMKAFGDKFNADQLKTLVGDVRSFKAK